VKVQDLPPYKVGTVVQLINVAATPSPKG